MAQHVVASPWDAVPFSTLACLASWVLAGLRVVCWSLSCSSLSGSRLCSPRRCSRTWSSLSSRFIRRVAAACLSGAVYVPRLGRARCVVLVRRRLFAGGQPVWVAWWPVWARLAVSGRCRCPYVACFLSGMLFRGVPGFKMSARVAVVSLALPWLVRHRLRRPMAGLSRCWTRWVVAVLKFGMTRPVPPWRHLDTHNSSPGISQCHSAVLSAALVPIVCTPPSVARPLRSPQRIPVLLMGASGYCPRPVVQCSCSCFPACCVPYRAVSCGFCAWRVGAAVRCAEVRVAWFVLWCRGVPSSAAGWARRNTPVFAGTSWRACGSRVASPWPLACPW